MIEQELIGIDEEYYPNKFHIGIDFNLKIVFKHVMTMTRRGLVWLRHMCICESSAAADHHREVANQAEWWKNETLLISKLYSLKKREMTIAQDFLRKLMIQNQSVWQM